MSVFKGVLTQEQQKEQERLNKSLECKQGSNNNNGGKQNYISGRVEWCSPIVGRDNNLRSLQTFMISSVRRLCLSRLSRTLFI